MFRLHRTTLKLTTSAASKVSNTKLILSLRFEIGIRNFYVIMIPKIVTVNYLSVNIWFSLFVKLKQELN